ncbi:MAG: transposase [Oxalobacteraceae bacterium]|nr:MAG: transposase [Oxalobacteraceae bacterium]
MYFSSEELEASRPHDPALYPQRHPIENLFAELKNWRRLPTGYGRCADIFMGAVTLAAIVMFWPGK